MGEAARAAPHLCLSSCPGVLFPSVFSMLLSWVSGSLSVAIAFLTLSLVPSSLCQVGALVNFLDIAPR